LHGLLTHRHFGHFPLEAQVRENSRVRNVGNLAVKSVGVLAGCLVLVAPASRAVAQIVGFGGSTDTGWTPNANSASAAAAVPNVSGTGTSADVLSLTTTAGSEASSYWFNTPQSITNFTESFTYTDNSTNGADGISVAWQNAGTAALGGGGGALGYSGIISAAGLGFNIYSGNSGSGSEFNGTVTSAGNPATTPTPGGVNLDSGHPINVSLSYKEADSALTEKMTDSVTNATFTRVYRGISIQNLVGSSTATVGFTGATGGVTAAQSITNFQFTPGAAVATPVATITPIAATGWSQNMIVSATTGNNLTASNDSGTSNTANNALYEQGVFAASPSTGVPKAGTVFGSMTDSNHTFVFQPNGAGQNDAILLDVADPTGALTLTTPHAYSEISLLAAGANGGGNFTAVLNYANGSSQTVNLTVGDWFGGTPIAWDANGRIIANGSSFSFNNQSDGNPRIYQLDFAPSDTTDAITSINFTSGTTSGTSREVIYGISGTASVPEPATLALLAVGALSCLGRRRRA
jgi:hypothetical protein